MLSWRIGDMMADCGIQGKRELIKLCGEELIWLQHRKGNGGTKAENTAHALVQLGQNRILNADSSISLLNSLPSSWSLFTLFH